ncbi:MAG TPA: hypothetical protein VMT20_15220 [Terriglobia bacterium]|nr:hypothetical protein [Terriglobia bacterium]
MASDLPRTSSPSASAAALLAPRRPALPQVQQIKKVDLGPQDVAPAQPDPQPAIPHMVPWIEQGEKQAVWRLGAADTDALRAKAYPALQAVYPHLEDGAFAYLILSSLGRSDSRVLRAENAFGYASTQQTVYDPRLQVQVHWVVGPAAEAALIYQAFAEWAQEIRAASLQVLPLPGTKLKDQMDQLGAYSVAPIYFFELQNG